MNAAKDGGPAFPVQALAAPGSEVAWGMSLRDWFAGQETCEPGCDDLSLETLEALAGRPCPRLRCPGATAEDRLDALAWNADWRSKLKYIRADAMIRARESGQESDGDEAWFAKQPDACVSVADDVVMASSGRSGRHYLALGSTREATLRALRAKVEGGAQ